MKYPKIKIEEYCDSFRILIKNTQQGEWKNFLFSEEDTKENLVKVFNYLGFEEVSHEDAY